MWHYHLHPFFNSTYTLPKKYMIALSSMHVPCLKDNQCFISCTQILRAYIISTKTVILMQESISLLESIMISLEKIQKIAFLSFFQIFTLNVPKVCILKIHRMSNLFICLIFFCKKIDRSLITVVQ